MSFDQLSGYAAAAFASPYAIVAVIVICVAWGRSKKSNNTLTLLLSILAITTTQLVLVDAAHSDEATQAKLDAILKRIGEREMLRAEERPSDDIEEMRK